MTHFKNILGTFIIIILLSSCSNQRTNNETAKHETPEALQDNKLDFKSYTRSEDLVEDLYKELVGKSPIIKKLEDNLDAVRIKAEDFAGKFDKYNIKSNRYYSSAEYKASSISDSLLKHKILLLIKDSRNKYESKTAELNSLVKQISKNSMTLSDQHSVLKIVLTLPLIEKYQGDNSPDKKEFKDFIKEEEGLIEKMDSLISNHP